MPREFRKPVDPLCRKPLHPQRISFLRERRDLERTSASLQRIVLDVDYVDGHPRYYTSTGTRSGGHDYYSTAADWCGTRPDNFIDAQDFPFADDTSDHVLLLSVVENLPEPELSYAKLYRALKCKRGNRLGLSLILLSLLVVTTNFYAWPLARRGHRDDLILRAYRVVWKNN